MEDFQEDINTPIEEEINPLLEFTDDLTEDKVLEKVKSFNSSWDIFSPKHNEKLKKNYTMYRNFEYLVEGVAVKIPEVFQIIETELPHLLNSIFAHSEVVDIKPRYIDPNSEKTYKVKTYINKLIKDVCQGRKKTELVIKDCLIHGWAVSKIYWDTEPDKDVDPITKEVIDVNSAHPNFYLVDPFSFAYTPSYDQQDINQIDWVRERIFLSKNKLREMKDAGLCGEFSDDDMSEGENKGKKERNNGFASSSEKEKGNNQTFYDEFWCKLYSKDENGKLIGEEYLIWLLSNKKIIKFQKNLYRMKPYTITRAYSNPHEFLGMGEAEVIGPLAAQLSYVHWQSGNLVKKLGQSMTFIGPSAGISPNNLKRIESGAILLQNINDIKTEPPVDSANVKALVEYKGYLDNQIEVITGVTKYLQGTDIGDMTATQASLVAQSSTNRLANKLTHIQEDFIVPLGELFFKLNKQLLQLPIEFFDGNNNLVDLSPEDFIGNYDFVPVGSVAQSNKALQLQQNQALLGGLIQGMAASQQTPNPYTVNIPAFITQLIAPFAGIANPSRFIIEHAPMPQGMLMPTDPNAPQPPMDAQAAMPAIPTESKDIETMSQQDPAANLGRQL